MISNCLKIPIPEKRKLLALDDQERAKSSPSRTPVGRPKAPSAIGSATSLNNTDTSTSSSIGDTSANSSNASTRPTSSNGTGGAIRKQGRNGIGHTGITRTPKKEMKCHLCGRKFLNAGQYALHVQAHAKGMESLETGAGRPTVDGANKARNGGRLTVLGPDDASKIVQKLVNLGKKV